MDGTVKLFKKVSMSVAKPIFIAIIPIPMSTMDNITHIAEFLGKKFTDYHVLVMMGNDESQKEVEFKCFYDKDLTEAHFEELKKMIIDHIEKK